MLQTHSQILGITYREKVLFGHAKNCSWILKLPSDVSVFLITTVLF